MALGTSVKPLMTPKKKKKKSPAKKVKKKLLGASALASTGTTIDLDAIDFKKPEDVKKIMGQLLTKMATLKSNGNASTPKSLNNPTFPSSCQFDPDKREYSDIENFLMEFEDLAELVDAKFKLHHLRMRLSSNVRFMIRQRNQTRIKAGKKALSYVGTRNWLTKTFMSRDADDTQFRSLVQMKQGKSMMRSFFTRFQSKVDQMAARNRRLDPYVQRKFILDGINEHIRTKAMEIPEYYSMPMTELKEKLIALDEALVKPDKSVKMVTEKDMQKAVSTAVAALRSNETDKRKKSQKKFTTSYMKPLYTDAEWKERGEFMANKTDPKTNTKLFCKDCFPIINGKASADATAACVFCKKLGHTILECSKIK